MVTDCVTLKGLWETSLVVQWSRVYASNAVGVGVIPGQGTKIPHATRPKKKKKKKKKGLWDTSLFLPFPNFLSRVIYVKDALKRS